MDPATINAISERVFSNSARLETLMERYQQFSTNPYKDSIIQVYRCLVEHNLLVEQLSCCPYYSGFIKKGNKQLLEYGACSVIPRSEYERTDVQKIETIPSAINNLEVRKGYCNLMLKQFIIDVSIPLGYTPAAAEALYDLTQAANRTWFDQMRLSLIPDQLELLRYFGAELKDSPLTTDEPLIFFIPEVAVTPVAGGKVYTDSTFDINEPGGKVAAHLKPVKAQSSVNVAARSKFESLYGPRTTGRIFQHIHNLLTTIYTGTNINAATDLTLGQCYSCVVPEVGVKISNICLSSCMAAAISIVQECFSGGFDNVRVVNDRNVAHAIPPTAAQLITDLTSHLYSSSFVLIPISLVSHVPKRRTDMAEVFKTSEIFRLLERIDVDMMKQRIQKLNNSTIVQERVRLRQAAAEVVSTLGDYVSNKATATDFEDIELTPTETEEIRRKKIVLDRFKNIVGRVIRSKNKRSANANKDPSEKLSDERRAVLSQAEEESIIQEATIEAEVVKEELQTHTLTPFVTAENNLEILFEEQKNMVVYDENNLTLGGKTLSHAEHATIMEPLITRESSFEAVCEILLVVANTASLQILPYRIFDPESILLKCTQIKCQVFDSSELTDEIIADVKNPLLSSYTDTELDGPTFYHEVLSDFFKGIVKKYERVFYDIIGAIFKLPATVLLNSLTPQGMQAYCLEVGKVTVASMLINSNGTIPTTINPHEILNSAIFKLFLINYFLNYKFYLKSGKTARIRDTEKDAFIIDMQRKNILKQRISRTYEINVGYALDSAVFIIDSLNTEIFKSSGALLGGTSKKILNKDSKSKKFLKKYKNTKKNIKNRKLKTKKITNIKVKSRRRRF